MQTPITFYIRCNMVSALVDLAKLELLEFIDDVTLIM
jgi:hypothetical protein